MKMKARVLAFFLVLALSATGCISTYNHGTPEKLGKTIFKILQKQDEAGLSLLAPTEKDLESFLATADMPEDELAAFKLEMKQIIGEFQGATTASYQAASDAASREGIVLSKAKLGDIRSETWQGPDNMLGNVDMDVTYEGKKYVLKIQEAGKVASGWVVGMKGFTFLKAGE